MRSKNKLNLRNIEEYWKEIGKNYKSLSIKNSTPTSRDPHLNLLERYKIIDSLKKDMKVLEIGCGDGSSTIEYARHVRHIEVLDISKELIKIAQLKAKRNKVNNINFTVASLLDLNKVYSNTQFDCVISQRTIINLPTWDLQKKIIYKIFNILRHRGIFILTEGFVEELENLNRLRNLVGLGNIKIVKYNKFLTHRFFDKFIKELFSIKNVCDYGQYIFISRLFYPFYIYPKEPKHYSQINKTGMEMCNILKLNELKNISYNLLYVLKK